MSALDRFFDWKWLPAAALVFIATLFLFVNRHSYSTYFDGADLVRLEQFSRHTVGEHLRATVEPDPGPDLDAPLGRLAFALLSKIWRGSPKPYIIVSDALHLVNLSLLLALAVRLGLGTRVTALALGVFGFHAGVSEVFWTPGHLTEPLCGCFVLLSLLFWILKRPVWSAAAYWLAIQINLSALFLPLALLLYVWLMERDRVRWLAPHALLMVYGLIQLVLQSDLRFSPAWIWNTLHYYVDELLVISQGDPTVRALILLLGFIALKKLHRFTYALFLLLLLPLLLDAAPPGEHSIYVPLIGVALFLASLADELGENVEGLFSTVVVFLWLAFNLPAYTERAAEYGKQAELSRQYIEKMVTYQHWPADGRAVLVDGAPQTLGVDGVRAALRLEGVTIPVEPVASANGMKLLNEPSLTLLDYSSGRSLLIVTRMPGLAGDTMLYMDTGSAVLQLGPGWYGRENGSRWTAPRAAASLRRPEWGDKLAMHVSLPRKQIDALRSIRLGISWRGKELWQTTFEKPGDWTVTWNIPAELPVDRMSSFDLAIAPSWTLNGREVGLDVLSFGYTSSKWKQSK